MVSPSSWPKPGSNFLFRFIVPTKSSAKLWLSFTSVHSLILDPFLSWLFLMPMLFPSSKNFEPGHFSWQVCDTRPLQAVRRLHLTLDSSSKHSASRSIAPTHRLTCLSRFDRARSLQDPGAVQSSSICGRLFHWPDLEYWCLISLLVCGRFLEVLPSEKEQEFEIEETLLRLIYRIVLKNEEKIHSDESK